MQIVVYYDYAKKKDKTLEEYIEHQIKSQYFQFFYYFQNKFIRQNK